MRNECNDYHYFFHYKRDRCLILQDKNKLGRQFENGYARDLYKKFEEQEVARKKQAAKDMERVLLQERAWIQEKIKGKADRPPPPRRKLDENGNEIIEEVQLEGGGVNQGKETPSQSFKVSDTQGQLQQKKSQELQYNPSPMTSKTAMGHLKKGSNPSSQIQVGS